MLQYIAITINRLALRKIIVGILIVIFLLSYSSIPASAQYGLGTKVTMLIPRGDLGVVYKKGPMYEGYLSKEYFQGRFTQRLGFYHTKLKPRLDTFRSYGVVTSGGTTVYPGYIVYDYLSLTGFYLENNLRFFEYKGFSFHGGIGLTFTLYKQEYVRDIEAIISEGGYELEDAVGLRFNIHAAYNFNKNLQVYVEGMHNLIVQTDWSKHFSHNAIGLGINYTLYFNHDKK